ncbi:MAG: hypothetical protein ACLUQ6_05695 [Alistipes onderdonkii]
MGRRSAYRRRHHGPRVYRVNRIVLVNLMYLTIGMSFTISALLPPTAFVWFAVLSAIEGITSSVFQFVIRLGRGTDPHRRRGVLGRVMSAPNTGFQVASIGGYRTARYGVSLARQVRAHHHDLRHRRTCVICTLGLTAFCIPSVMRLDRQSKSAELQTKATDGK